MFPTKLSFWNNSKKERNTLSGLGIVCGFTHPVPLVIIYQIKMRSTNPKMPIVVDNLFDIWPPTLNSVPISEF